MNAPSLPAPAKAGVGPLYALSVLSGLMLGFSFPPSRMGVLACVGLVPLLAALSRTQRLRQGLKLSYVAMLVFHVITLNWTGGYSHGNDPYMMIAGAVTMIAHPLFYFLPLGGYLLLRSWRGEATALGALPFLWVGYEYSHSLTEWSFPWLTLGNSQTYDLARIQFITATGVYGLSLWIIVLNIFAYLALKAFLARRATDGWSPLLAWLGLLAVVYAAPSVEGTVILNRADVTSSKGKSITVGLIQSNIDPWDKWSKTGGEAARTYVGLTDSLLQAHPGHKPELVLWPETALPVYLLTPGNAPLLHFIQDRLTALDISVLTGIEHAEFYPDSSAAPPSARRTRFGERYDAFNAAAFLQPGVSDVPWYGKMKMVPLAERIPYADIFASSISCVGGWELEGGRSGETRPCSRRRRRMSGFRPSSAMNRCIRVSSPLLSGRAPNSLPSSRLIAGGGECRARSSTSNMPSCERWKTVVGLRGARSEAFPAISTRMAARRTRRSCSQERH